MNKIKIIGVVVFMLSLSLAFISVDIANKNRTYLATLNSFTGQKALVQEISKSIFYSYRNGIIHPKILDNTIMKYQEYIPFNKSAKIKTLWSYFYADVKRFRKQQQIETGYNPIITAKLVNRIYDKNMKLMRAFDLLIELKKSELQSKLEVSKEIQKILFLLLIVSLFYLFTQLHWVLEFVHKFSKASKKIIKNTTIQGVEPIHIGASSHELKEATENYNYMVQKMNLSLKNSTTSMNQSIKSLEEVAQNIENFMELLSTMNPKESDDFFKKEDAVIDSLDTLMHLRKRLKDLKIELDKLL